MIAIYGITANKTFINTLQLIIELVQDIKIELYYHPIDNLNLPRTTRMFVNY